MFKTRSGGQAVQFDDIEILKQQNPSAPWYGPLFAPTHRAVTLGCTHTLASSVNAD